MRGRATWGSLVLDLPQDLEDETVVILRAPEPANAVPLRLSKGPTLRPSFVCKQTSLGPNPPTLDQLADVEIQALVGMAAGLTVHSRGVEVIAGRPTLLVEAYFDTPSGRIRQTHATTVFGRVALSFAATALDDAAFPSIRATLRSLIGSATLEPQ
jgi:hypothetical protein